MVTSHFFVFALVMFVRRDVSGAVGLYSSVDGQSSCTACSPGLFANTTNATSCTPCAAGRFAPAAAATSCSIAVCSPGNYTPTGSIVPCTPCPAGLFSAAGTHPVVGAGGCSASSFDRVLWLSPPITMWTCGCCRTCCRQRHRLCTVRYWILQCGQWYRELLCVCGRPVWQCHWAVKHVMHR